MGAYNNPVEIFNELYLRYYKSVVSYFSKRFDPNEAEDLAQTVFLKLWAYIPCAAEIGNKKSLVFKIAKNVLVDRLRQKKLLENHEPLEEAENVGVFDDVTEVELREILKTLTPRDRETITLKTDGWSSREIALVQKTSASAVRMRLASIRKMLEKKL